MKRNWLTLIGLVIFVKAFSMSGSAEEGATQNEWQRTNPDIVVYIPRGEVFHDTDNEHFDVFPSPSGKELLAVWTQSSCEGRGDNRAVIARSSNAVTWSAPQMIIGSPPGAKGRQAEREGGSSLIVNRKCRKTERR